MSLAAATIGSGVLINGYVLCSRQAESSSFCLAAQSQALQRIEQVRAAKWDTVADPPIDQLATTNFPALVKVLDLPCLKQQFYATNYVTISVVSVNPPLKLVRAECVWTWVNGKTYTNSVVTYRGPDQ